MRINTMGTFLERMLQNPNKISSSSKGSSGDNAQGVDEVGKNAAGEFPNVEKIYKMANQSLASTAQTLGEIKALASAAIDESLSQNQRIDMQIALVKLQSKLHKNTSSLGMSMAGKEYEDIKDLGIGEVNFGHGGQEMDIVSLVLSNENLREDPEVITWERGDESYHVEAFGTQLQRPTTEEWIISSYEQFRDWKEEDFNSYVTESPNAGSGSKLCVLGSKTASAIITQVDKQLEKLVKIQEEFKEFNALSNDKKFAPLNPRNNGFFASDMGDTVSISYGTATYNSDNLIDKGDEKNIKKMSNSQEKYVKIGNFHYVSIGDATKGKLVRRDIWDNRFKKTFSELGEMEAYGIEHFDFRLKTSENEYGKMVKKVDAFLKDEVYKNFGFGSMYSYSHYRQAI